MLMLLVWSGRISVVKEGMPWVETVSGPPVSADHAELDSPGLSLLAIINTSELFNTNNYTQSTTVYSTVIFVENVNSKWINLSLLLT